MSTEQAKTIQQCKDEVAKLYKCHNWKSLLDKYNNVELKEIQLLEAENKAIELYASFRIKAVLEEASKELPTKEEVEKYAQESEGGVPRPSDRIIGVEIGAEWAIKKASLLLAKKDEEIEELIMSNNRHTGDKQDYEELVDKYVKVLDQNTTLHDTIAERDKQIEGLMAEKEQLDRQLKWARISLKLKEANNANLQSELSALRKENEGKEKVLPDRLKEKIKNIIEELREESLVDFMRASDRERVVNRLHEFIESQIS